MTKYNDPEFKVVISKTEDVLTASPFDENDKFESEIMPLGDDLPIIISG